MKQFRRPWGPALLSPPRCLALVVLALGAGCSRPVELPQEDAGVQAEQHQAVGRKAEAELPFRESQNLPAGTLLTVRLTDPINADRVAASGTFVAIVDEPLSVDGNTLIPRGASVAGRVESARASEVKHNIGFVRLTLDSIDLSGRALAVQTSSLFARGNVTAADAARDSSPAVIRIQKGRRLTFRLTEPVSLASNGSIPGH